MGCSCGNTDNVHEIQPKILTEIGGKEKDGTKYP